MFGQDLVANLPVPHEDGSFVSAEVSRVIECIKEYDHRLEVRWIPPAKREPGDAAFAICEHTADGRVVVAFYVQTEADMNLSVLEKIYAGDNAKHNVQIAVEAKNDAYRALQRKKYEDQLQQAHDEAAFLWRTGKHTVKHNGKKLEL